MTETNSLSIESLLSEKFNYLKKRWWIFLLTGLLAGTAGFIYASLQKASYKSRLTFALDDGSAGESSFTSLASQFGLSIGGSNNIFQGDNIIEIMRSRRMVETILLSVDTFNNKPYRIIEYYMDVNDRDAFHKKVAAVHFPVNQSTGTFTYLQDSVLKLMYERVVATNLTVDKPDRKYNIFELNIKTPDEKLSHDMTIRLLQEANTFYTELKTKKASNTLAALENRIESVKSGLYGSISNRANVKDANVNPVFEQSQVPVMKEHTNIELYSTAYAEMFKNLEIARFQYLVNTPILQIIDDANYPMEKIKPKRSLYALAFCLSATFLLLVFFLMKEQQQQYREKGIVNA